MISPAFMLHAPCVGMDPELFDSDDPTPAQLLCAGCPVQVECAEWHMQPINVSDYVVRFAGYCPDETDDIVYPSGVKAAGMGI